MSTTTNRPLKERLPRVAKLYLAYKFLGTLYFSYPIFYQYAVQVITPVQVGLFFSTVGIVSFLADIPTGIIADKHSRKFSGLCGMSLLTIAPLLVFLGHSLAAYLLAAVFYGLGGAFLNGALDSLVYDHKDITKIKYRRVNALEITFGQTGIVVSAALGGFLFLIAPGLPFVIQALAGLACIGVIAVMNEEYNKDYIRPVTAHTKHFKESVHYLFSSQYLRVLVLMGVVFSVMLGMCIQFVHEAAMIEYGLNGASRGLLIASAGVAALVVINAYLLRLLQSDTARLIYISAGAAAAYALMGMGYEPLFFVGYLLWCCLNATSVFVRLMLQDRIPSSHRATIMSSFKTIAVLVGLCASTGTGLLVQVAGTPRIAYIVFAGISCVMLLPCATWLVKQLRQSVKI